MTPGAVRLAVADLDRVQAFYERALGLSVVDRSGAAVHLGADGIGVVELEPRPEAVPRPPRTTGLFHLAILVPSRLELARALARLVRAGWRLSGASDHLVSEALYLDDPEGNGIEIYRDRPRDEWSYDGGEIRMSTLPLDIDGLLAELSDGDGDPPPAPAGTRIGHVHLNVADLEESERFYVDLLGFDVTVRGYPGALFVSTGGYHHHIGMNTWAGVGAPPPPSDSRGLVWFELIVEGPDRLGELEERLRGAGVTVERGAEGLRTADPSRNALLINDDTGSAT